MTGDDARNDPFAAAILNAIRKEIAAVANEEAEAAAERVRQRTKARINEIAVGMFSQFSMERDGRDLIIKVKHEGGSNGR